MILNEEVRKTKNANENVREDKDYALIRLMCGYDMPDEIMAEHLGRSVEDVAKIKKAIAGGD